MATTLECAAAEQAEPPAQLVAVALAYITFALYHAAEFELLFRYTRSRKRSVDPSPSPFDLLRKIVRRGAPSASAEEIGLACPVVVHSARLSEPEGVSSLRVRL